MQHNQLGNSWPNSPLPLLSTEDAATQSTTIDQSLARSRDGTWLSAGGFVQSITCKEKYCDQSHNLTDCCCRFMCEQVCVCVCALVRSFLKGHPSDWINWHKSMNWNFEWVSSYEIFGLELFERYETVYWEWQEYKWARWGLCNFE